MPIINVKADCYEMGDGYLFATLNNRLREKMYPVNATDFYFKTSDRTVSFIKDNKEKVLQMNIDDEGKKQVAEKIE